MRIQLTEQAYATFTGRGGAKAQGMEAVRNRLQTCADGGGMACIQWQGAPALYALDAYWRYEETQEDGLLMTECVGVFRALAVPRWGRAERRTDRLASQG